MDIRLIGDTNKFAIEYKIFNLQSSLLEGEISYWINNKRLGNNQPIYLNDVLMCLIWKNNDNWNRKYHGSIKDEWNTVFNKLFDIIYNSDDINEWNYNPARYDISLNINNELGKYTVFYFEYNDIGHLLYSYNQGIVEQFSIEIGYVDNVISTLYEELNELLFP